MNGNGMNIYGMNLTSRKYMLRFVLLDREVISIHTNKLVSFNNIVTKQFICTYNSAANINMHF